MQLVAALRVLHLARVIPAVLRLKIRQHQLSGLQDLHVLGGIAAYLFRGALVPFPRRISDGVAPQSRRASPRAHHVPAEGPDSGRHSIGRHLRRHPRALTLTHSGATGHPKLILDVLLQVGRFEVHARRRQRLLAVIELLAPVNDSAKCFFFVHLSLANLM